MEENEKEFEGRENFLEKVDRVTTPPEIRVAIERNRRIWNIFDTTNKEEELTKWIGEIRQRIENQKPQQESKVKVSVVIPAKDEERSILQILDTLSKQQTAKDMEIIVVANNCKDKTAEIARKTGVKVIEYSDPNPRKNVNKIALARQRGVEKALGEVIVFTDADTLVPERWIDTLTKPVFDGNKNVVMTTADVYFFDRGKNPSLFLYDFARFVLRRRDGVLSGRGANMAVRKDDLLDIGGVDHRIYPGEDWYIGKQISWKGEVLFINDPHAAVRVSPRRFVDTGVKKSIGERFPGLVGNVKRKYQQDVSLPS